MGALTFGGFFGDRGDGGVQWCAREVSPTAF